MNAMDLFELLGGDITDFLSKYGVTATVILVLALTCIQMVPQIKFNPWTKIFAFIGRLSNAEVINESKGVKQDVSELRNEVQNIKLETEDIRHDAAENKAVTLRTQILRFGDEVFHGESHSKEHFDQILDDITLYEKYCETHPEFPNERANMAIKRIKDVYMERLEKNDFL